MQTKTSDLGSGSLITALDALASNGPAADWENECAL